MFVDPTDGHMAANAEPGAGHAVGIVIPAHNEEAVIGRCLEMLFDGAAEGEFQVVVVPNGCSDRTAEVARRYPVTVVETAEPGKVGALALGDRMLTTFPRVYLDADVELDAAGVRALTAALRRPGVLAAAPSARYDSAGMSAWARRSHRVHAEMAGDRTSLTGKGAYALGAAGHARVFPLPQVLADDCWVDRSFTAPERVIVADAVSVVRPARTVRSTIRRRVRVRMGNREIDALGKRRTEAPFGLRDLRTLVRRRSVGRIDALAYLALVLVDHGWTLHGQARRKPTAWMADATSRGGTGSTTDAAASAPHVLIIVQNLPVPLDRRVWLECRSLRSAGYEVSVICPKGPSDPGYAFHEGVHLYKYAPPREVEGALGYAWEFLYCWLRTASLSLRVRRRRRFDVIQACNPPDTYWLLARLWRASGVKFVFDHHDLNPEVFRSRFGEPSSLLQRAQLAFLYWLERRTFAAADHVISTNGSYREIALRRGNVAADDTTIVRSGPDTSVMKPSAVDPSLLRGGDSLVAYLGIMGPQDGVDGVLDVAERIVRVHGRTDVRFAMLGFGDCLEDLKRDCTRRGLDEYVSWVGRVGPPEISAYLSAATVGICPDPMSPLNNISTMNKTMEYMAYALPVVTYRLRETVVSAGECAVYVEPGDVDGLADAVLALVDDPERCAVLGRAGRSRAVEVLDWRPQSRAYLDAYTAVTGWQVRRSDADLPGGAGGPRPVTIHPGPAARQRPALSPVRR